MDWEDQFSDHQLSAIIQENLENYNDHRYDNNIYISNSIVKEQEREDENL